MTVPWNEYNLKSDSFDDWLQARPNATNWANRCSTVMKRLVSKTLQPFGVGGFLRFTTIRRQIRRHFAADPKEPGGGLYDRFASLLSVSIRLAATRQKSPAETRDFALILSDFV